MLLLSRASAAASVNYTISALPQPLPVATESAPITGALSSSASLSVYRFDLGASSLMRVHDLGSDPGLSWSIAPVGRAPVWSTLNTDSQPQRYDAGEYQLWISGSGTAANYALQLLNLDAAPQLTTANSGTLTGGKSSAAYSINLAQNSALHLSFGAGTPPALQWSLLNGWTGALIASGQTGANVDLAALSADRYVLVLEGQPGTGAAASDVTYMVTATPFTPPACALGQEVNGTLDSNNPQTSYHLNLPVGGQILLYDTGSDSGVSAGVLQNVQSVTQMGNGRLYSVSPGDNDIVINGSATSLHYQFAVLDYANAPALPAGTAVPAQLNVGQNIAIYSFTSDGVTPLNIGAAASAGSGISWTVYSRQGVVTNINQGNNAPQVLQSGDYRLVVYRSPASSGALAYTTTFNPVVIPTTALTMGSTQSVTLDPATAYRANYTFTLTAAGRFILVAPDVSEASANYNIVDAQGVQYASGHIPYNVSSPSEIVPIQLQAGTYTLRFDGGGYYSSAVTTDFRLIDIDAGATLSVTSPATLSFISVDDLSTMHIAANAGDTLDLSIYMRDAKTANSSDYANWWVIDPDNNQVLSGEARQATSTATLQLTKTGNYAVIVSYADPGLSVTLNANLASHTDLPTPSTSVLVPGQEVKQSIQPGVSALYTLDLSQASLVSLGGLASTGGAQWQLYDASGTLLTGNFSQNQASSGVMRLAAGSYTLQVDAGSAGATPSAANVDFTLLTQAQAVTLASGSADVPAGPGIYALPVSAGQDYYFSSSAQFPYTVYRQDLSVAYTGYSGSLQTLHADASGTWYVVINQGGGSVVAAMSMATSTTASTGPTLHISTATALSLDQVISGSTAAGCADVYSLSVSGNSLVSIGLPTIPGLTFVLNGPGISQQTLSNGGSLIHLGAGNYTIVVTNSNANVATYDLLCQTLDNSAPQVTLDTTGSVSFNAAGLAVYRLQGTANQQLYYAPQDGEDGNAHWTMYDANGVYIWDDNANATDAPSPVARRRHLLRGVEPRSGHQQPQRRQCQLRLPVQHHAAAERHANYPGQHAIRHGQRACHYSGLQLHADRTDQRRHCGLERGCLLQLASQRIEPVVQR
jgi:hypothetical protein